MTNKGSALFVLGVCLEVVATLLGTSGKQLLRFSGLCERQRLANGALVVGLCLNVLVGPIVDGLAYSFAPQSVLAPLCGLDVIWNCLLAPYTLNEKLTWSRLLGCVMLTIGMIFTAVLGPHHEPEYTVPRLSLLLFRTRVYAYCIIEAVLVVGSLCYIRNRRRGDRLRGVILGVVSGFVGGNLFCLKATSEFLTHSISTGDWAVWTNPLPCALALGAVILASYSAAVLTRGMREHEALMMVTTYEGSFAVSGCASACLVLSEMDEEKSLRIALYASSVGLIVLGIIVSQYWEPWKRHSDPDLLCNGATNSPGSGRKDIVVPLLPT